MKTLYFHYLKNAVELMHYRYGKGEIVEIMFDLSLGKIYITAKCTSCKPHTVKATYDGKTLKAYRHQMRVTVIGGEPL